MRTLGPARSWLVALTLGIGVLGGGCAAETEDESNASVDPIAELRGQTQSILLDGRATTTLQREAKASVDAHDLAIETKDFSIAIAKDGLLVWSAQGDVAAYLSWRGSIKGMVVESTAGARAKLSGILTSALASITSGGGPEDYCAGLLAKHDRDKRRALLSLGALVLSMSVFSLGATACTVSTVAAGVAVNPLVLLAAPACGIIGVAGLVGAGISSVVGFVNLVNVLRDNKELQSSAFKERCE